MPLPFTYPPATRVDAVRLVVLASFTLLLFVQVVNHFWAALPLLIFVYGLIKADWRSHIWLCFVLLFYFLININRLAYMPNALDYAETGLLVTLFVAAMLYCRWSKQAVAASPSPPSL